MKWKIPKIWVVVGCALATPGALQAALPRKLAIQPISSDFLVFPGDDQWHAGYTLILTNYTMTKLKVSSVTVTGFDQDQDQVFSKIYAAADLPAIFSSVKGNYNTPQQPELGPGESGVLYFFLDFKSLNNIPQTIANNFLVETEETGNSVTISIARLQRRAAAPEIVGPPLRGDGWVTPNGPSNEAVHRRTLLVIDGALSLTEEFAVDWVKLGQNGATFSGDPKNNASYFAYNQDIVAAAAGRIVKVRSDLPDNTPPQSPNPAELEVDSLAGNHVVEDFGDGRYALYAHMIPGSVTVQVDDVVTPGQVIGRLGNSGNSTQPHLHFHVMDGPQPLGPRGVPFVINSWLRTPYQIICQPDANCDPGSGPTESKSGTPVQVHQQAFMNLDFGRF